MKMNRQEILEILKETVVTMDESYAPGISEVNERTELLKDLCFSSLQMVFLVVMLEDRFHIRLENLEDLNLVSIGDVVDLIERLTQAAGT